MTGGAGAHRLISDARVLRPTTKRLPRHTRSHNRALVLQTIYSTGTQSRADVARITGLTRAAVSDLVAELMSEGLLLETGQREEARPGKPATLIELNRNAFQIVGIDLSDATTFRGGLLDLSRRDHPRSRGHRPQWRYGATGARYCAGTLPAPHRSLFGTLAGYRSWFAGDR